MRTLAKFLTAVHAARMILIGVILCSGPTWAQVCGDCDKNGAVNIIDALQAAQAGAGLIMIPASAFACCDVNASRLVEVVDALLIAQFTAGLGWTIATPCPPPDWTLAQPYTSPWFGDLSWTPTPIAHDSARGVTVFYGLGLDGDETWEWDGATMQQRSPLASPAVAAFFINPFYMRMVYDVARGVCVLVSINVSSTGLDVWEYDGATWTNNPAAGPGLVDSYGLAYDENRGVTVLFGGASGGASRDTWEYDGVSWTLVAPALAPPARSWCTLTYDPMRQRVILFGGDGGGGAMFDDVWEYDGVTWSEAIPASTRPPARRAAGLVHDPARNRTIMFGGLEAVGLSWVNDTWEWDGSDWAQVSPLLTTPPPEQIVPGMVFDPTAGTALMWPAIPHDGRLWSWDGVDWSVVWTPPQPLGEQGTMAYMPALGASILYDAGARECGDPGTWMYDGLTWSQLAAPGPSPRRFAPLVHHAGTGTCYLFGGRRGCPTPGGPDVFDETWEFNGVTWTQVFPPARPSARFEHGMAYDALRNEIVVFGGTAATSGGVLAPGDTWVWGGTTWTQRFPATSPPARTAPGMATDAARGVVVMFGGHIYSGSNQNDTWEWDGSDWTQVFTATLPPEISGPSLAYHHGRGQIVLHGGAFLTPARSVVDINETWEYDGIDWTPQLTPTQTPLRSWLDFSGADAHTYDTARDAMVVHRWGTWEYR